MSVNSIQNAPQSVVTAAVGSQLKPPAVTGVASFASTIANLTGGASYSNEQIKSAFASTPNAEALAKKAASMGLNEAQIQFAMQANGYGGTDPNAIKTNIEAWVGDAGNGYTWDVNGTLTSTISGVARVQGSSMPAPGGLSMAGQYYSPQQIKDFYTQGTNLNMYLQQQGVTDQAQIHSLNAQAEQIAGTYPTGEAALQNYFKEYQKYNPNGAHANDYAGWKNDQDPVRLTSMLSGGFTGAVTALSDWEPGGIYGPGSAYYGQAGYGNGLGPRGMGSLGGGWDSAGAASAVVKGA